MVELQLWMESRQVEPVDTGLFYVYLLCAFRRPITRVRERAEPHHQQYHSLMLHEFGHPFAFTQQLLDTR